MVWGGAAKGNQCEPPSDNIETLVGIHRRTLLCLENLCVHPDEVRKRPKTGAFDMPSSLIIDGSWFTCHIGSIRVFFEHPKRRCNV